jgi:uncharacterized RDD family membrane protein YckC
VTQVFDKSGLESRLRHLSLDDLTRMATTDRSQYREEAIALVEAELASRGVTGLTIEELPRPFQSEGVRYGGFWRRFGAYWLDIIAFIPLIAIGLWLSSESKYYYLWAFVPGILLGLWYHVYLVKRFGGTPGKLLMNLRIQRVDGARAGWREASLRYLVIVVLSAFQSLAVIIAAVNMPSEEYLALGFMDRSKHLIEQAPAWYGTVNFLLQLWVWGEFVVMLTNKRRRALHDFMAGTVVIHQRAA